MGLYSAQLQRYQEARGTDHGRIRLYEYLATDPEKQPSICHGFLGVSGSFRTDTNRRRNRSAQPRKSLHGLLTHDSKYQRAESRNETECSSDRPPRFPEVFSRSYQCNIGSPSKGSSPLVEGIALTSPNAHCDQVFIPWFGPKYAARVQCRFPRNGGLRFVGIRHLAAWYFGYRQTAGYVIVLLLRRLPGALIRSDLREKLNFTRV